MLVDAPKILEMIFSSPSFMTHCEDTPTIRERVARVGKMGEDIPMDEHPNIRSHEACYLSSSLASSIKKTWHRLHVLHLTAGDELFEVGPIEKSNGRSLCTPFVFSIVITRNEVIHQMQSSN